MKNKQMFAQAVLAGLMIGISGTVYLSCENKIVGAVLFSLGLMSICALNLPLFTGRIGYALTENRNYVGHVVTWLGNLVGCVLCGAMIRCAKPELTSKARNLITEKLSVNKRPVPVGKLFILGVLCGVLMFVAVHMYNEKYDTSGRYMGIMLCVPAFILSGFEHSIADMFYASLGIYSFETFTSAVLLVLIVTLGNATGSILFNYILNIRRR